jgi:hypothetical protein
MKKGNVVLLRWQVVLLRSVLGFFFLLLGATKPSACSRAAAAVAADGCGTDGGGWELAGKPPGGLGPALVPEIFLHAGTR